MIIFLFAEIVIGQLRRRGTQSRFAQVRLEGLRSIRPRRTCVSLRRSLRRRLHLGWTRLVMRWVRPWLCRVLEDFAGCKSLVQGLHAQLLRLLKGSVRECHALGGVERLNRLQCSGLLVKVLVGAVCQRPPAPLL